LLGDRFSSLIPHIGHNSDDFTRGLLELRPHTLADRDALAGRFAVWPELFCETFVYDQGLDNQPDPIMYIPVAQVNDGVTALNNGIIPITWVIRTSVEPYSLSREIEDGLRMASDGLPVAHIRSIIIRTATTQPDRHATLGALECMWRLERLR